MTPVAYLIFGRFSKPNAEKAARLHRDIAAAERMGRERDGGHGGVVPAE